MEPFKSGRSRRRATDAGQFTVSQPNQAIKAIQPEVNNKEMCYFLIEQIADLGGLFRFQLCAGPREILVTSSLFATKAECLYAVHDVRILSADDANFSRCDLENSYRFNLYLYDYQSVTGGKSYKTRDEREKAISAVRQLAAMAVVRDNTVQMAKAA